RGVCRPFGSERAPCRADATCDPGLDCQLTNGATAVVCLRPVLAGQRCDVAAFGAPRCARGLSCALRDGATAGLCQPDGSHLALCRGAAPPCDPGLRCHPDFRVCAMTLSLGTACVPATNVFTCVEGASCGNTADGLRCLADGSRGGRCRTSEEPCEPGLRCELRATPPVCVGP
ncbi:MAG: hypothetical protein JWM10_4366, partial [Myxococcaceae bacterium]|nr:hypothetical protein [Myxococcaceae bacterium]